MADAPSCREAFLDWGIAAGAFYVLILVRSGVLIGNKGTDS